MAHTCPECGQMCHCGSDIDDCLFDFEEDVVNCTHWLVKFTLCRRVPNTLYSLIAGVK